MPRPAAAHDGGVQVWRLTDDGRDHRVEADPGMSRRIRWYVDDELVAERKAMEDRVRLSSPAGELEVRFSGLGAPRRATLGTFPGGTDLVPDPGSKADAYEQRVREHPTRYAVIATVGGVARVVVPILLAVLAARFALSLDLPRPNLPLPDLPSIPAPDLPTIPWPSIPWPDWSLPGWVGEVLDKAKYVWPVVLAFVLARAEIRRRKQQDERRQERSDTRTNPPSTGT